MTHRTSRQLRLQASDTLTFGLFFGAASLLIFVIGLRMWSAGVVLAGMAGMIIAALSVWSAFRTVDRARIVRYNEDKSSGVI